MTLEKVPSPLLTKYWRVPYNVPGGSQYIQVSVAVEVVEYDATSQVVDVKPQVHGDILKRKDQVFRGEKLGVNQSLLWHLSGEFTQGHISQVEEPAGAQIIRKSAQDVFVNNNGFGRARGVGVDTVAAMGKMLDWLEWFSIQLRCSPNLK